MQEHREWNAREFRALGSLLCSSQALEPQPCNVFASLSPVPTICFTLVRSLDICFLWIASHPEKMSFSWDKCSHTARNHPQKVTVN